MVVIQRLMLIFTDLPNIRVLIIKQIAPRESRDFIDFPLTFGRQDNGAPYPSHTHL